MYISWHMNWYHFGVFFQVDMILLLQFAISSISWCFWSGPLFTLRITPYPPDPVSLSLPSKWVCPCSLSLSLFVSVSLSLPSSTSALSTSHSLPFSFSLCPPLSLSEWLRDKSMMRDSYIKLILNAYMLVMPMFIFFYFLDPINDEGPCLCERKCSESFELQKRYWHLSELSCVQWSWFNHPQCVDFC